ncbi:hypothetical protein [Geomonas azotofigens]|uniref:hypothetical protein n=1 Tax=Geomonas azotofigens TaxID=2843196 RepID=UPI001C0F4281|nr:hypothetical protein [Geomonas azotofigens]MBU5612667.1 hypothetical protein [Geomonas azotofigens]
MLPKVTSLKLEGAIVRKQQGYIRLNGISETGDTKQAQALRLFLQGTTKEEYAISLRGYTKSFDEMLRFFIANGYSSSSDGTRTYLKKQ